jgi:hypothetical protein
VSPLQLLAGEDRRIHHGINFARNAIYAAVTPGHPGCGILDTDLIAAFDWLCLDWAYKVLEKKGLPKQAILRLQNLYRDNVAVVVVNSIQGKCVKNVRLSLKQGDLPSMDLFSYAGCHFPRELTNIVRRKCLESQEILMEILKKSVF